MRFVILGLTLASLTANAVMPVKVGNANDGRDLENLTAVVSGPIFESRAQALAHVKSLDTAGIAGLGKLQPEIEKTELFVASDDVKASISDDFRPDHLSGDNHVYARTLAEPYAPTRFFPISLKLSQNQLVALHIHEALHRALPEKIREDESIVARLTLALSGPGATHDGVAKVAAAVLPVPAPEGLTNRDLMPSQFGYQLRSFINTSDSSSFAIYRAHLFQSYLYPFGDDTSPFGLGLEGSLIERSDGVIAGPLGISGRLKAFSKRGFHIDITAGVDLNTLSSEELRNSPYGRDILRGGIVIRKDINNFYIENAIEVSSGGNSNHKIGNVDYRYSFGTVVKPSIHVGGIWKEFHFGSYFDMFLADHFRVNGGAFNEDKGRYRIVAVGPEFEYRPGSWIFGLSGRFLVDSTKDADFSALGNVLES